MKRGSRPETCTLSPTQLRLLERYELLLRERGGPLGLVSSSDRDRLMERHIMDSLRAVPCIPDSARSVADVGSGGGLPGIPVAIARADLTVYLVESRTRRAAFLELAVERLVLPNVRVIASRVEGSNLRVDGCLARALAAPGRAWQLAEPILTPGGFLLYWAGRSWGPAEEQALASLGTRVEECSPASEAGQGSVVIISRTVVGQEQHTS